jgi:Arc/MetJ-type ribon-helix-helix transcriptional regulator
MESENYVLISLRLPKTLKEEIQRYVKSADAKHLSVSEFIRDLLREKLSEGEKA